MFTDHQLKWRPITFFGTSFAFCVLVIILFVEHEPILPVLTRVGIVATIIWFSWLFFTRVAWRWRFVRLGRFLISTPDLNGRWVGTTTSSYDNLVRPVALEIRQTLLKVQCIAYGPDNSATSYSARILSDADDEVFKLAYLYHSKRSPSTARPGDEHEGLAILSLKEGTPRRLEGYYLNDRDPTPRKAEMKLTWDSKHLIQACHGI
jgi:hypothetical protein